MMKSIKVDEKSLDFSRLIFLHIPKAGGTTLHKILDRVYGNPINLRDKFGMVLGESLLNLTSDQRENLFMVKGHMHFGLHKYIAEEGVKYITFLRDPVERVVSHYFFVKRTSGHYLHKIVKDSNMTLLDYALSDLTWELDNGQVRNLINGGETNIQCSEKSLEEAKRNLKELFVTIGITEKFDESLILLKNDLKWNEYPCYKKSNVAKEKPEVSAEVLQKIGERNDLDVKLYEWALTNFERSINLLSGFEGELELFRKINRGFRMGFSEGKEEGVKSVYSKYILLRAQRFLKRKFGPSVS